MIRTLTTLALITTLNACGPSAAEIAIREQIKTDSIAKVAKEELLNEQAEAEEQKRLKQQLMLLKAELAGAKAKLESIHGFKLLRTQDEKARQITNQTYIIEELKAQIEEINKKAREN